MTFKLDPGKLGFKLGDVLIGLQAGSLDVPEAVQTTAGRLHVLHYAWNPDTLSWEVATTRGAGAGQEVYVTNPGSPDLSVLLDTSSSTTQYVGKAQPGTATSAPSWKIFRLSTSPSALAVEYADGDAAFDNVWDDRTTLDYS